jgi:hypothetical protein
VNPFLSFSLWFVTYVRTAPPSRHIAFLCAVFFPVNYLIAKQVYLVTIFFIFLFVSFSQAYIIYDWYTIVDWYCLCIFQKYSLVFLSKQWLSPMEGFSLMKFLFVVFAIPFFIILQHGNLLVALMMEYFCEENRHNHLWISTFQQGIWNGNNSQGNIWRKHTFLPRIFLQAWKV